MDANVVILSKSEESSPLTVINTILKDVKFNKQFSQFTVNGSHIIIITASVPIYDEVGEGQYILRRQKWETGFRRRMRPIPPQAPPSWQALRGHPSSRRARQGRR